MFKTLHLPGFLAREERKGVQLLLAVSFTSYPDRNQYMRRDQGQLWTQCCLLPKCCQYLGVVPARWGIELTWPRLKWWTLAEKERVPLPEEDDTTYYRKTVLQSCWPHQGFQCLRKGPSPLTLSALVSDQGPPASDCTKLKGVAYSRYEDYACLRCREWEDKEMKGPFVPTLEKPWSLERYSTWRMSPGKHLITLP